MSRPTLGRPAGRLPAGRLAAGLIPACRLAAGRLAAGLIAAGLLAGAPSGHAAPPPRYGGALSVLSFGPPPTLAPAEGEGPADATAALAVFEPLYALDEDGQVVPRLAEGPPVWVAPDRVRVPIRGGVARHDGRPLDARAVAAWLRRLARPRSPAGHLVLPLVGGRERVAGRDLPLGVRAPDPATLELDLVFPYPHLERLFTRPEAAVVLDGPGTKPIGTGPFAVEAPGRLAPFLAHREGRPFLDRLTLDGGASRFGVDTAARRGEALVFGSSRPPCPDAASFLVLSVGEVPGAQELARRVHRAVDRRRLARRYLPEGSSATATLFGGDLEPPPSDGSEGPAEPLDLVVSRALPGGQALAKRVQLELLRTGLPTTIEARGEAETRALRRDGAPVLLLERIFLDASEAPVDRFHALLALASRFGQPLAVASGRIESFARAPAELRPALVETLEAELLERLRLIVLARLSAGPALPATLLGARPGPGCAIDLASARWAPRTEPP